MMLARRRGAQEIVKVSWHRALVVSQQHAPLLIGVGKHYRISRVGEADISHGLNIHLGPHPAKSFQDRCPEVLIRQETDVRALVGPSAAHE